MAASAQLYFDGGRRPQRHVVAPGHGCTFQNRVCRIRLADRIHSDPTSQMRRKVEACRPTFDLSERTSMNRIGTVESVWRYPVKSMRGEALQEVFAWFPGVYGDRLYAFRNSKAPKGFPYLTGRELPTMLLYQPRYQNPERMTTPPNLAEAEAISPLLNVCYMKLGNRKLGATVEHDEESDHTLSKH